MVKGYCDWVDTDTLRKKLKPIMEELGVSINDSNLFCDSSQEQNIAFNILKCVKYEEIEERKIRDPERIKKLEKLSNPETLLSIPFEEITNCFQSFKLPKFGRNRTIANPNEEIKYFIEDGVHRTAFAKQKGLPCILAEVSENYEYTLKDQEINSIESKDLLKMDEKQLEDYFRDKNIEQLKESAHKLLKTDDKRLTKKENIEERIKLRIREIKALTRIGR